MPMVPNLLLKPEKSPQGSIHLYAKSYIAPVVKQPETQHAYKTESFASMAIALQFCYIRPNDRLTDVGPTDGPSEGQRCRNSGFRPDRRNEM